jgi:hypothetical protein
MTKSDLKISQKTLEKECRVDNGIGFEKTIDDWYMGIVSYPIIGFVVGVLPLSLLFSLTNLHREYTVAGLFLVFQFIVCFGTRPSNLLDRRKLIYESGYKNEFEELNQSRKEIEFSDRCTREEKDSIKNKINHKISELWNTAHCDLDLIMNILPGEEVFSNINEFKKARNELESIQLNN